MASSPSITATFCATLVDEWVRAGLRTAIVSPGSRSTPMALALVAQPEIAVEIFHDERSAAFAALGVGLQSGLPAILLCTSGTAAVEFHPAIVEAHEARVPMLVCTADRPPELQGVGAPQTIDQRNLYGVAVRRFEDPGVADSDFAHTWRELAQRMLRASLGVDAGPVHLNLAFREPLIGEAGPLPALLDSVSPIAAPLLAESDALWLREQCDGLEGVFVAGRGVDDPAALVALAARMRWPVIADPRSGCRESRVDRSWVIAHADSILRTEYAARLCPQVIVRVGEPPASKVVNAWIASSNAQVIALSTTTAVHDPERVVTRQILGRLSDAARALSVSPAPDSWGERWRAVSARADEAVSAAANRVHRLTEPLVARCVAAALPLGSSLVVSSSMPIRDIEWFARDVEPTVLANRGANGIDGVMSTAVGVAIASRAPVGVLVGDVAFLHDSNALLGLAKRSLDLRMVLVDNDGGGIFSFLPQAQFTNSDTFEALWGTPHGVDFAHLVAAHGLHYVECSTIAELQSALAQSGPIVIRVQTNRQQNVIDHDEIHAAVAASLRELLD